MKTSSLIPWAFGLFVAGLSWSPLLANPIDDHPLFKSLVGQWEGSGTLKNEKGEETPVKETWTGKFTETGNFIMSGKRLLDQNEHEFAWEYYANDDLIEGQMKISEPEIDRRFEVEVSDAARLIKMKIPMDGAGTLMVITNRPSEDGKSIKGTVKIVNQAGETTLSGTVEHRRIPE